jgi:hypothetical protein
MQNLIPDNALNVGADGGTITTLNVVSMIVPDGKFNYFFSAFRQRH